MQIKVLSRAGCDVCNGGDITLASVLRNLNFAQRIKPFPGHTESARIQNYAAPKFNFLQPSKHFNFKETYFDCMGGGVFWVPKRQLQIFEASHKQEVSM